MTSNMTSNTNSPVIAIDVRKYSFLKNADPTPYGLFCVPSSQQKSKSNQDWTHYPFRGDISLTFIPLNIPTIAPSPPAVAIKVAWKTTILEELDLSQLFSTFADLVSIGNPPILIVSKSPCIGVKYLIKNSDNTIMTHRFQLRFPTDVEFQKALVIFTKYGVMCHEATNVIMTSKQNKPKAQNSISIAAETSENTKSLDTQEQCSYTQLGLDLMTPTDSQYDSQFQHQQINSPHSSYKHNDKHENINKSASQESMQQDHFHKQCHSVESMPIPFSFTQPSAKPRPLSWSNPKLSNLTTNTNTISGTNINNVLDSPIQIDAQSLKNISTPYTAQFKETVSHGSLLTPDTSMTTPTRLPSIRKKPKLQFLNPISSPVVGVEVGVANESGTMTPINQLENTKQIQVYESEDSALPFNFDDIDKQKVIRLLQDPKFIDYAEKIELLLTDLKNH